MEIGKKTFGNSEETELLYFSWKDIDTCVGTIAAKIDHAEIKFNTIIGLSRGGLIPGVMLSHKLNCKFVPVVWQTRDDNVQWTDIIQAHNSEDVLIVDDLVDSGRTFNEIKVYAPKAKWATLLNKKVEIPVDFSAISMYNDSRWCVFPWEEQ